MVEYFASISKSRWCFFSLLFISRVSSHSHLPGPISCPTLVGSSRENLTSLYAKRHDVDLTWSVCIFVSRRCTSRSCLLSLGIFFEHEGKVGPPARHLTCLAPWSFPSRHSKELAYDADAISFPARERQYIFSASAKHP